MIFVYIAMAALVLGQFYLAFKAAIGSEFDAPTYLKKAPTHALERVRPLLAIQHILIGTAFSLLLALFFINLPVGEIKGLGAAVTAAILVLALTCRVLIHFKVRQAQNGS